MVENDYEIILHFGPQVVVPIKYSGIFPPKVVQMFNKDALQVGIWYESIVIGSACMNFRRRKRRMNCLAIGAIRPLIYVVILPLCLLSEVLKE